MKEKSMGNRWQRGNYKVHYSHVHVCILVYILVYMNILITVYKKSANYNNCN
jgi:hypothetical protein